MRVGLVAKGLLLKGDKDLELVLLCSDKPTIALLNQVAEKLTAQLEVKLSTLNYFTSFSEKQQNPFLRFRTFLFFDVRSCLCSCNFFFFLFVLGYLSWDLHSRSVSRGCSHYCEKHQGVDPNSHYPPHIASCQDRAREQSCRRRGRRYVCWPNLRDVLPKAWSVCSQCADPVPLHPTQLYNWNATQVVHLHLIRESGARTATVSDRCQWTTKECWFFTRYRVLSSFCDKLVFASSTFPLYSLIHSAPVVNNNHKKNFVYSCWIVFMFSKWRLFKNNKLKRALHVLDAEDVHLAPAAAKLITMILI